MKSLWLLFFIMILPVTLYAQTGQIEVTASGNRLLKLAVDAPRTTAPLANPATAKVAQDVLVNDMNVSGVVTAEGRSSQPDSRDLLLADFNYTPWLKAGFDMLVKGEYSLNGDRLTVEFRLFDVINRKMVTAKRYLGSPRDMRRFSHQFADEILRVITGEKGVFTTRIDYVATHTGNKEIYVMDWDGTNPLPLTKNGSINLNPDFSPDGSELIFTSYKRGNPDLYRRSLSSKTETIVSNRKGLNITGSWSPDGGKIALALSKDGDAEIYTIDRDGGRPVRLTINPALDLYPAWSPDGKRIAFVSDRLGKPQIFTMNADGGEVKRLTTSGNYNVNPRWSPKGDKIAFSRMTDTGFNIFTISPDGSSEAQLTTEGNNENPSWSGDGRFICFGSKRNGGDGVYIMRADGSGQMKVSQSKGKYFQPVWSSR